MPRFKNSETCDTCELAMKCDIRVKAREDYLANFCCNRYIRRINQGEKDA